MKFDKFINEKKKLETIDIHKAVYKAQKGKCKICGKKMDIKDYHSPKNSFDMLCSDCIKKWKDGMDPKYQKEIKLHPGI